MFIFGKTLIVLIDAQDLRRIAFTNLFSSLLCGKNVLLLDCNSVDAVKTRENFPISLENTAPLFILNAGAVGLSDARIAADIADLRALMPRCLVLVMLDAGWNGEIEAALAMGINGVVCMSMPPQNVVAAIEIALMGATFFPSVNPAGRASSGNMPPKGDDQVGNTPPDLPHLGQAAATRASSMAAIDEKLLAKEEISHPGSDQIPLSRRQIEVLKTLQSGLSNKEIARTLGLSEATIKIHVRHLMRKFGVVNRTQVAVLSRHGGSFGPATTLPLGNVPSL